MDTLLTDVAVMKNSVKSLDDSFKSHLKDDKEAFEAVIGKIDELKRHVYIGIGILVAVQYFLK